ncbi:metal ABC transporter solute-binding protein, Zn/Mn family [Azospirillum halopraeferens]|uniref:metal ABC transporter solute-binding protein, Zn/Mn family n=1 Tax=Azospirillum halopraeferens TaxID=34010 RepID=UPI00041B08B0|nr:zinc ABC transporter substrate-binding protein [Azospirillum halopraeferens]
MATGRRRLLGALGALALLPVAGRLVMPGPATAAEPLRVVATTGMIADLVRAVAGERAEVVQLMGAGVDPHLYRATRTDMAAMLRADVIFYNGLLLEGRMTDAFVRVATSGKPVHAVTELIGEERLLEPDGADGHYDPHVWMDPTAWAGALTVVRDALVARDPAGEPAYRAGADGYHADLDRLHAYSKDVLDSVPPQRRVLVTAHDAFGYFGRAYGFEVVGIQGLSTESEAGLQAVESIVGLLVERRIPAVFVESTIPDRSVRALVAGAAARGHTVAVGGELYSDAMGPPGTYEGTYVGMIDHNVTTIARALGGDAPERGLDGRLAQAQ